MVANMNPLDLIKSVLPWVGTALGGPLGGVAASFIGDKLGLSGATVDTVKAVLGGMSAEDLAKYKQADQEFELKMATLKIDALYQLEELNLKYNEQAVLNAADINKTMQSEAASEHWPSYSWRPAIGFAVAFNLVSASVVVFVAYIFRPSLVGQIPEMLTAQAALNGVAMPVLGIASWFRGKTQEASQKTDLPVETHTTVVTKKG